MNNHETNDVELKNLEAVLFEINCVFKEKINDALLLEDALTKIDENLAKLAEEERNIIERINALKNISAVQSPAGV